ncbi:MAG: DUF523 domain-containing protein [Candidatus Poribacteria bacterium]
MILVSACLLGINCKYNGSSSLNKGVLKFIADKGSFVACCPELLGGLPIPRGPYEITGGTGKEVAQGDAEVLSQTGEDVTREFLEGAKKTVNIARRNGVKLAILKAKSPSCGVNQIYDGAFSGTLIKGDGVTATLLRKEGIELISDEEIKKTCRNLSPSIDYRRSQ